MDYGKELNGNSEPLFGVHWTLGIYRIPILLLEHLKFLREMNPFFEFIGRLEFIELLNVALQSSAKQ